MQSATQTAVDDGKDFNQTREHDHRDGVTCWCGHGDNVGVNGERITVNGERPAPAEASERGHLARPPGPANIHRASYRPSHAAARIDDLENKLRTEQNLHSITAERLRVAMDRIKGFEAMTASLAKHIDEMQADMIFQAGDKYDGPGGNLAFSETPGGTADVGFLCRQPGHFGICMLPYNHAGPCDAGQPLRAA